MIIEENTEDQFLDNLTKTYTATNNEERRRAEEWLKQVLKTSKGKSTLLKLLLEERDTQTHTAAVSVAKWLHDADFFINFMKIQQVSAKLAQKLRSSLTTMLKHHEDKPTLMNIIFSSELSANTMILLGSIIQSSTCQQSLIDIITTQIEKIVELTVKTTDKEQLLNIFQFFQTLFEVTAQQEQTYYAITQLVSSNNALKNKMISLLNLDELQYKILYLINIIHEQPLQELFNYCLKEVKNGTNYQNLQMLDRYVNSRKYHQYFQNNRAEIILSLMKYCVADQKEKMMSPEDFMLFASDFCDRQQLQENKIKASTILDSMCHIIDGTLSFVVQISMKAIWRDHNISYYLNSFQPFQPQLLLCNLQQSQFFKMSRQSTVQSSLLILCSLSDKIEKRADLLTIVLQCLDKIPVGQLSLLCQLRYMMLLSYYPQFMNRLMSVASANWNSEVVREQTVDCFSRIHGKMKYKRKQSEEYGKYQLFLNQFIQSVQIQGKLLVTLVEKITQMDDCRFSALFERLLKQLQKSDKIDIRKCCFTLCTLLEKTKDNIEKYEQMFVNACGNMVDGAIPHVLCTWLDKSPNISFLNSIILQQVTHFINNLIELEDISQMLNRYLLLNVSLQQVVPTLLLKTQSEQVKQRYLALLLLEQMLFKAKDDKVAMMICTSLPAVMLKDIQQGVKITVPKIVQYFITMDIKYGTDLLKMDILDSVVVEGLMKYGCKSVKIYCIYLIHYLKTLVMRGSDTTLVMKQIVVFMKLLPRWKNDERDEIQKIDKRMKHHFEDLDEYTVLKEVWQEVGGRLRLLQSEEKEQLLELLRITKFNGKERKVVKIKR